MRRREFITLVSSILGCAATAWPLRASAQNAGRIYRLGGLSPSPRDAPQFVALLEQLHKSGFIEGQNLLIDWRTYGQQVDRVSEFAAALVLAQVDVIFAGGDFAIRAAQSATTDIPIIGFTDDMIGSRLVSSLARPSGNTTGFSLLAADLDGKRQDLFIEAIPGVRRIATFSDATTSTPQHLQALQSAAGARQIELSLFRIAQCFGLPIAVCQPQDHPGEGRCAAHADDFSMA